MPHRYGHCIGRRAARAGATLCLTLLAASVGIAQAQTCANPLIPGNATTVTYDVRNSCSYGNALPYLWGGMVATPGRDVVYRIPASLKWREYRNLRFSIQPTTGNFDPAMFACTQCSTNAACINGVDSAGPGGAEQMTIAKSNGAFYLIVDSTSPTYGENCGAYTLTIQQQ